MKHLFAALTFATVGLAALAPTTAHAFCGFYVSDTDEPLYNDATQVVMMRDGTKTVLSMRNTYRGPTEDFAMVVPVPVVLEEEQVKTLDDAVFDRLEKFSRPRLVEYFERNPCQRKRRRFSRMKSMAPTMADTSAAPEEGAAAPKVVVEAMFDVGEYEIVILSATESNALETWLKANKYNIPDGAAAVLKPYIEQGTYFFVARVNASKVKFDSSGQAQLSPLRFDYEAEDFSLPVRLGLLNAEGEQDLLVHILSREGRFRVANYPNEAIPTNLVVDKTIKPRFNAFYEELFSAVHRANPRAVVTEFAWGGRAKRVNAPPPVKCDPCVEPMSQPWSNELWALGADLVTPPPADGNYAWARFEIDFTVGDVDVKLREPEVKPDAAPTEGEADEVEGDGSEEVEAPPKPTYDPAQVRAVFESDQLKANGAQCYEQMVRRYNKALPQQMSFVLGLAADGRLSGGGDPAHAPEVKRLEDELFNCLKLRGLAFTPPDNGDFILSVTLDFDARVYDGSLLQIEQWTVTRLHARYTAEQLTEDLVFVAAPAIVGGRGTPAGEAPQLPTTPKESQVNNFQARYMILYPYQDFHVCLRPRPGIWTGGGSPSQREAAANIKIDEDAPINLRALIHSEIPLLQGKARVKR